MALNTLKCNHLMPLPFKGLIDWVIDWLIDYERQWLPNNKLNWSHSKRWVTARDRWLWRERIWEKKGFKMTVKTPWKMPTVTGPQWRRQPWGTGAHAPWNFAAVQTMAVLIFLPSSVSSKLDRAKVTSYCGRLLQKFSAIFVFADLTPDGFHFWMTLSPRTSEPVRHTPVPPKAKFWRRHCWSMIRAWRWRRAERWWWVFTG